MFNETPIIVYGDDGPVFERVCPKCRRFVKFPKVLKYRAFFDGHCKFPDLECSRCGPVKLANIHIGWADDYR